MSETRSGKSTIAPEIFLERLTRAQEMREFFIQMWLQNPQLAKQGGAKVKEILSPLAPLEERRWTR